MIYKQNLHQWCKSCLTSNVSDPHHGDVQQWPGPSMNERDEAMWPIFILNENPFVILQICCVGLLCSISKMTGWWIHGIQCCYTIVRYTEIKHDFQAFKNVFQVISESQAGLTTAPDWSGPHLRKKDLNWANWYRFWSSQSKLTGPSTAKLQGSKTPTPNSASLYFRRNHTEVWIYKRQEKWHSWRLCA